MNTRIYNTMTQKVEEFKPLKEGEVKIYTCGPTVYNYIHIGNARPMIVFDCFRRYLKSRGYKVVYVQNFTDVDDKIIKKAAEEGVDFKEIASKFIGEYRKDAEGLGVAPPTIAPLATESMENIIKTIENLIENGYAYPKDGDVYFSTKKFKGYGKLSHMPIDELEAGKRIEINDLKEDPLDFAVWKRSKDNEPFWESPWGKGRPGWHIECSAMAAYNLGFTIDIHCGGRDLIFPHHENEIAQSECAFSVPFANYWMHNGYINIDNEKMSKSKGNFFTVREIAQKYGYNPIRFMMLSSHYRSPINFSDEVMEQSKAALLRLKNFKENLDYAVGAAKVEGNLKKDETEFLNSKRERYYKSLDNDFNTADAIGVIFELVRETNPYVVQKKERSKEFLSGVNDLFLEFTDLLGILEKAKGNAAPEDVVLLFEKRNEARGRKDYTEADRLRDEIRKKGYIVEETKTGSRLKRVE